MDCHGDIEVGKWGFACILACVLIASGCQQGTSTQTGSRTSGEEAGDERLSVEFPQEAAESLAAENPEAQPTGGASSAGPEKAAADRSADSTSAPFEAVADPDQWASWPDPKAVLVFSAQQNGYIEPCGCTGLENQKGGLARRDTLIEQLQERGWPVAAFDGGNQVRRFGTQAGIKFHSTVSGLQDMAYQAIGFGPDDLRLGVGELLSVAAVEDPSEALFVSANVVLVAPELMPRSKVVTVGEQRIGVTTAMYPGEFSSAANEDLTIEDLDEGLAAVRDSFDSEELDFRVLLLYGTAAEAKEIVRQDDSWDVILAAGDQGEPGYQPVREGDAKTRILVPGHKGMHVCLIALYDDAKTPVRYGRVALTHDFPDSPEMMELLADYQSQLKSLGLEGLGVRPISHPTGRRFVGTEKCGECHTSAYDIWVGTPHYHATDSLIEPGERTEVPRHFDPECLSCHVTGWNPQRYYPYTSGYLSLEETPEMVANGCENCHGPGADHVAAEQGDVDADDARLAELRSQMRLPLARAREVCVECHDHDNSPDFHDEGAFDEYWQQVEHYGLD